MENNSNYVDYPAIAEIYGSNGFLKVKPNMLDKGKVIFSFVTTDANKKAVKEKSFDVFLDVSEALAFGKVCENGMLYRWTCNKMNEAQKNGKQYPDPSWTSSLGVSKGEERKFFISKATKGDYLFTAQKRFGTISKDNAGKVNFHPYDKNDSNYKEPIFVRIPTSEFALIELSVKITDAVENFRLHGLSFFTGKPSETTNQPALSNPNEQTTPEPATEDIPNIPMPSEDITYPYDGSDNAPAPEPVTPKEEGTKAYKVTLTSLGAFEFDDKIGYLRVCMNGKEIKPMKFEKPLNNTAEEKALFLAIQRNKGAVEFTCLAKDIGEHILFCGLTA